jgi:DNA-binding HxlR family transcriptional regulator
MHEALEDCPVAAALRVIDGKWTPLILLHLKDCPQRFNALRRAIPAVTQRVLTLHLRELERHGVLQRTVHPTVPPQVEYRLTDRGRRLAPIIEALEAWGRGRPEAARP